VVDFETLGILACPLCGGGLRKANDGLTCPADGAAFPTHPSGLLDLRPPDGRAAADSSEAACALPDGDPPGFTRLYWTVRRESWAVLAELLGEFGTVRHAAGDTYSDENIIAEYPEPVAGCRAAIAQGRILRRAQDARILGAASLTIADLGAGFPWLSHRLSSLGHAVLAVDLSPDADFGLGAARLFPTAAQRGDPTGLSWGPGGFLPLLGDLEWPPLALAAYDVVICNASLHYAHDLRAAVARMAQALRSAGALVIVDSPIITASRPGRDAGRGLDRALVENALRDAGLTVTWHRVPRGWLWQRHQLKNWLLRRPGFEFPVVVGMRVFAP
jgi:SAM-dependent methyltransferase